MSIEEKYLQVLLPSSECCQKCAVKHETDQPHDQQSLYWQYWFYGHNDNRWPTWSDAMAHCNIEVQRFWRQQLRERMNVHNMKIPDDLQESLDP